MAVVAVVFGLVTLKSGGEVLFGSDQARRAVGSALTFLAFGLHVLLGGAYEMRTVIAMTVRTGVWIIIAVGAFRLFAAEKSSVNG